MSSVSSHSLSLLNDELMSPFLKVLLFTEHMHLSIFRCFASLQNTLPGVNCPFILTSINPKGRKLMLLSLGPI
jgi:hypothetical protein